MLTVGYKKNKHSAPIGYIKGGVDDGTIIYLTVNNVDMTTKEREKQGGQKQDGVNEVEIYDGVFQQIPKMKDNKYLFRSYASAPSLAGKTTYII